MLPCGLGKGVQGGFDPVVGGLLAAGTTKSRFARMRGFDAVAASWTDEQRISQKDGSADQHFQDVGDNAGSNQAVMREKKIPPVAVVQQDVSQFDSRHVFHDQKIR